MIFRCKLVMFIAAVCGEIKCDQAYH
jgi:hypothetical protein